MCMYSVKCVRSALFIKPCGNRSVAHDWNGRAATRARGTYTPDGNQKRHARSTCFQRTRKQRYYRGENYE